MGRTQAIEFFQVSMTPADWLQTGVLAAMLVGIILAYQQLKRISRSIKLARQGNTVNVIAHCGTRYEAILSAVPKDGADDAAIRDWWYRYWDLFTLEFVFFLKGLLDPDIFELWISELANVYQQPPSENKKLRSRAETHPEYLNATLPSYKALRDFYGRLDKISKEKDPKVRASRVHELIKDKAPKDSPFEIVLSS